jgi:hypothetical protein
MTTLAGNWLVCAHATDVPARLLLGERSIEERLRIPKSLEPGRYAVHCKVVITKTGYTNNVRCYTIDASAPRKLVEAVVHATMHSRFAPAIHSGKPAAVFALIMVLVDTTLPEPLVLAVPNNGVERKRFGLLYTAPQRFNEFSLSLPDWPARDRHSVLVWGKLWIDEHGKVTGQSLTNVSHTPRQFLFEILDSVKRMQFVPGQHEGKPVSMLYMEPVRAID